MQTIGITSLVQAKLEPSRVNRLSFIFSLLTLLLMCTNSAWSQGIKFGGNVSPIKMYLDSGKVYTNRIVIANPSTEAHTAHATSTDRAWHLNGDTTFSIPSNGAHEMPLKVTSLSTATVRDTFMITDEIGDTIRLECILNPTKVITGSYAADTLDITAPSTFTVPTTEVGLSEYYIPIPMYNPNSSMIVWDSSIIHGLGFQLYGPFGYTAGLDSVTCMVSFLPKEAKTYSATLRLAYTDTNSHSHVTVINLVGTAIGARPMNCLSVTGADTIPPGVTDTVFITNNTGSTVIATAPAMTDTSGGWTMSLPSPDTIPNGAIRKIPVTNNHSVYSYGLSYTLSGDSTLICDGYYPQGQNTLNRKFYAGYKFPFDSVLDYVDVIKGKAAILRSSQDTEIHYIVISQITEYSKWTRAEINNTPENPDMFSLADYPDGKLDSNFVLGDWARIRIRFHATEIGEYPASLTLMTATGGYTNIPIEGIRLPNNGFSGVRDVPMKAPSLRIGPNPARSFLSATVDNFAGAVQLELIDVVGTVKATHTLNSGDAWTIVGNESNLNTSGTYFLRASGKDDRGNPIVITHRAVLLP